MAANALTNILEKKKKNPLDVAPMSNNPAPVEVPKTPDSAVKNIKINPDRSSTYTFADGSTQNLNMKQNMQATENIKAINAGADVPSVENIGSPNVRDVVKKIVQQNFLNNLKRASPENQIVQQAANSMPEYAGKTADQYLADNPSLLQQQDKILSAPSGNTPEEAAAQARASLKVGGQVVARTFVELAGAVRNLAGQQPTEVSKANQVFSQIDSSFTASLDGVRTGIVDPTEIESLLNEEAAAINRLESFNKYYGLLYPSHYVENGQDVQSLIIAEKGKLNARIVQLQAAAEQGRIARAQALLG